MVSCARAYKVHPVMSPKNPNFDKYFLIFRVFLGNFSKKIEHFGSPTHPFWVETNRGPLKYCFTSIYLD